MLVYPVTVVKDTHGSFELAAKALGKTFAVSLV